MCDAPPYCGSYHFQHSMECYADLRETEKQLKRFGKFFDRYCETKFPYTPPVRTDLDGWGEDVRGWSRKRKNRKHNRALVELPPLKRDESGHWWNERDPYDYDPWEKSSAEWDNWDEMARLHNEFN